MQARLKTSLKWTNLPQEYLEKVTEVFAENFEDRLESGESLLVEGRIYPEEVLMRVGIKQEGRLSQANFETSIAYNPERQDAVEQIYLAIDALASMVDEYLKAMENEESLDFPRTWAEYDFNGKKIFLQYSTINSDLEAEADRLLGLGSSDLVQEPAAIDALDFADIDDDLSDDDAEDLFEEEDEDSTEDTSKPSLFSGKIKH